MATVIDIVDGNIPVVLCRCGDEEIVCWDMTNICEDCGRAYNFAGQALRDPDEYTDYEIEMGYDN